MYQVIYSPQAYSFLEKLDKKTAIRIVNKINASLENPFACSLPLTDMGFRVKFVWGTLES